ncbi:hypothetical protein BGX26_011550 [Mortierella sp. AD094]|nr:hypothetical protein BGX26_011550 [Mortierella sp. AD094]
MSLIRHTARRSFNVVLVNNTPAVSRLPIIARAFSNNGSQYKDQDAIKHAPGWKNENASESEASVKADREAHPPSTEHLQRESVEHLKSYGDHAIHDLKNKAQAVEENVSKNAKEYANKAKKEAENVSENAKEYADKAKKEAEKSSETLVDGVKSGAEKVTQFVKESVDSAKKAVGMDK